jgi:hypothetical protein
MFWNKASPHPGGNITGIVVLGGELDGKTP